MDPWTIELAGVLLGPGTPYELLSVSGLSGRAPIRSEDTDRDGWDGVHLGDDLYGPKTVNLVVEHVGTQTQVLADRAALSAAVARAQGATLKLLRWRLPGQDVRRLEVRPREADFPPITGGQDGDHGLIARAALQLLSPQPFLLADTVTTSTMTIASGATQVQQTITVGGTAPASPVITWSGPTRDPRLTNTTLGRAIRIDVDVPTGQQLVVDVAARTVKLAGVDVYSSVRADNQWWRLAPAANVLIASRSAAALTGASAAVSIARRHAWEG